jgi:hypothetical protein
MPLTKSELDMLAAQGCRDPRCDHRDHSGEIFIHPRCHPASPTWTSYDAQRGTLKLICAKCRGEIFQIIPAQPPNNERAAVGQSASKEGNSES